MELRASIRALSFCNAFGVSFGNPWGNGIAASHSAGRVFLPIVSQAVQLKRSPSVAEITPKQLQRRQKKQEWRRKQRRMRRVTEQERHENKNLVRNDRGAVQSEVEIEVEEEQAGEITLISKFEEEFAMRVRDTANCIEPSTTETSDINEGELAVNSSRFREDSHSVNEGSLDEVEFESVAPNDWLLAHERRSNGDVDNSGKYTEEIVENSYVCNDGVRLNDGGIDDVGSRSNFYIEENGSRSLGINEDGSLGVQRKERNLYMEIPVVAQNIELSSNDNGNMTEENSSVINVHYENVEENSPVRSCNRSQLHFIENSLNKHTSIKVAGISSRSHNNAFSTCSGRKMRDRNKTDASTASEEACCQEGSSSALERMDLRVNPKTSGRKQNIVGQCTIDGRKGEPLATLLDKQLGDSLPTHGVHEELHEDATSRVWRLPANERKHLERLVEELTKVGKKQTFLLSRLMHGSRVKWTNGHLIELVKMLGVHNDWRKAMEVVHWVHCREHFGHCRSRYVYTTLLAVLGKCLRPVEALNVFNVMREDHSTYPDIAAYHSIAVTLGKAGHLTQLLHLIESLRQESMKKRARGIPLQLSWKGSLEPDIVIYNAVINACGPHREWEGAEWALQQIKFSRITPDSITYDLAIEVMVKSGQYDKAWKYYELMEREGFLPSGKTFKALVEALGTTGEVDRAMEMVEDMESRGVSECAGVYYALASALCTAGRLSEALVQVAKLANHPSKKPDVITFTCLIQTCEKAGRWQDAITLFNRMQYVCSPNVGTYNTMIALYGRLRMFEEARNMFEFVKEGKGIDSRSTPADSRLSPTAHTYESMLGACAACEHWDYFEVVLQEYRTSGFQLDRRRHLWFMSPIVKAGQERLIDLVACLLQRPNEPPNAEFYRVLLPLLSMHGRYTLVLNYLSVALEQGVVLNTAEWSSIVGKALEQLPMADAKNFFCANVTAVKVNDNKLVKQLLQCLISVGAETKARNIVTSLGLQLSEFAPDKHDSRLVMQEEENISSILENKPDQILT
nr:hypothetical protein PHYPA_014334 [Physcomitrium patens]